MSISVTPRGGALTARGGWNANSTYYQDDLVVWQGTEYQSLLPVNRGNQPDTSPTAWINAATASGLAIVATTGAGGYTLINGTGPILTWTAPNDGQLHRATIYWATNVTSNMTGGGINASIAGVNTTLSNSALGAGYRFGSGMGAAINVILQPGQTLSITQATALTAGAAVFYCEIWAS